MGDRIGSVADSWPPAFVAALLLVIASMIPVAFSRPALVANHGPLRATQHLTRRAASRFLGSSLYHADA